jgi:hypothetical protein
MLNAYFVEKVEEIIKQNNYPPNTHIALTNIEYCLNSIFVLPISENEVEFFIKNSKVIFQEDMVKYWNM